MTTTPDDKITNAARAARCLDALTRYNDEYDVHSNLVDFLADARHWCDTRGESFAELDRMAYQHYLVEIDPDRRRRG